MSNRKPKPKPALAAAPAPTSVDREIAVFMDNANDGDDKGLMEIYESY